MKTGTRFIGVRAMATTLLMAVCGHAAAPDDAPARSVKNLKLSVSANGRHFVGRNGKPFFYLGDTCWLLFQRANRAELDELFERPGRKGIHGHPGLCATRTGQTTPRRQFVARGRDAANR